MSVKNPILMESVAHSGIVGKLHRNSLCVTKSLLIDKSDASIRNIPGSPVLSSQPVRTQDLGHKIPRHKQRSLSQADPDNDQRLTRRRVCDATELSRAVAWEPESASLFNSSELFSERRQYSTARRPLLQKLGRPNLKRAANIKQIIAIGNATAAIQSGVS